MKKVEAAAEGVREGRTIKTYGPLIHNRKVLELLDERGVGQINSPEEIDSGTVVIRAHGVEREVHDRLLSKGLEVIDGTCPLVKKSMKTVRRFSTNGWHIILVGDASHGEIKALEGYASDVSVIENEEQARSIEVPEKTMVIAQTTVSVDIFQRVCEILKSVNPEIVVTDSICPATRERQKALIKLSGEVEAIVVIGGKNSSNTKRLFELACASGKPSWHIEEAAELPPDVTRYGTIGITAGASTPDWSIEEVEKAIKLM